MDVKEIFIKASKLIESGDTEWMCHAINASIGGGIIHISEKISESGFTRNNYADFIKKNFPELEKYLFPIDDYISPWIDTMNPSIYELVIESKVKFLKYLANENK